MDCDRDRDRTACCAYSRTCAHAAVRVRPPRAAPQRDGRPVCLSSRGATVGPGCDRHATALCVHCEGGVHTVSALNVHSWRVQAELGEETMEVSGDTSLELSLGSSESPPPP